VALASAIWIFHHQQHTFRRLPLPARAEFFPILNHPNFAQPNHNIIPGFMDNGEPGGPQIDPNPGAYPGLSRPRPYEASPANGLITQAAPPRPTPAWVEAARASFNWQ